jgi:hypothetical protein
MTKRIVIIIGVILTIFLIIFIVFRLAFKLGTGFVSSIDGDGYNNKTLLTKEFYFSTTDTTIWYRLNKTNTYKKIIGTVDSLNWDSQLIIGFDKSKYFEINVTSQKIYFFTSKDSLINKVGLISLTNKVKGVPNIKQ